MTDWRKARCIGQTDLFFSDEAKDIVRAKRQCRVCPIRHDCLMWALERGETYGIWGGYDYEELQIIAPMKGYAPPDRHEVEHGSERGWAWHRRRNEPPCHECRLGYNKIVASRMRIYRKRRRSG